MPSNEKINLSLGFGDVNIDASDYFGRMSGPFSYNKTRNIADMTEKSRTQLDETAQAAERVLSFKSVGVFPLVCLHILEFIRDGWLISKGLPSGLPSRLPSRRSSFSSDRQHRH